MAFRELSRGLLLSARNSVTSFLLGNDPFPVGCDLRTEGNRTFSAISHHVEKKIRHGNDVCRSLRLFRCGSIWFLIHLLDYKGVCVFAVFWIVGCILSNCNLKHYSEFQFLMFCFAVTLSKACAVSNKLLWEV